MLYEKLIANDIRRVLAKATGIPVQDSLNWERGKLVHVGEFLGARVIGQDHVVSTISDAVQLSREACKLQSAVALFLFLRSTGVVKMALCKALAAFLFIDCVITVPLWWMLLIHRFVLSTYCDWVTLGYVVLQEGGRLTGAVRRGIRCLHAILLSNKFSPSSIVSIVSLRLDDVVYRLKSQRISLDVDAPSKDIRRQSHRARRVPTDLLFPSTLEF